MKDDLENFESYGKTIHKENRLLWSWIVATILVIGIAIALLSCNNAHHMQVVNPNGYWMHGQYLSNHSKPKGYDSTILVKH